MATKTPNLKLNTWLESDVVNFEEVNENFEVLDGCIMCIASGMTDSSCSGSSDSRPNWNYKKYSNKTIEMDTRIPFANSICSEGVTGTGPYKMINNCILSLPTNVGTITSITSIQLQLSGENAYGWAVNLSNKDRIDSIVMNILNSIIETSSSYKEIHVSVKGVIE